MGGFVDGTRLLSLEDIEQLVRNEEIEYPIATREEIQDKSKGDGITKALVVLQTTWFLLQCAARGSQHLALTELELATAAFAILNIITYALWWDKPLDVHIPIRVRRRNAQDGEAGPDRNQEDIQAAEEGTIALAHERGWFVRWSKWDQLQSALRGWSWKAVGDAFQNAIGPFFDMMTDDDSDETFFVVGTHDGWNVSMISGAILVAMAFGGIHCAAWSFQFPSHEEQLLWKISSISITGVPLAMVGITIVSDIDSAHKNLFNIIIQAAGILIILLYPLSRILLLVLSLTTLRSLPPSAYQTVQWTTFLPHV